MMDKQKIYPRSKDRETVYLKNVVTDPSIIVGDYTMYNDFVNDPVDFQKNSLLIIRFQGNAGPPYVGTVQKSILFPLWGYDY